MHQPLCLGASGKLGGLRRPASPVSGRAPELAPLFYVVDATLGCKFLIDTGAQVSALPRSALPRSAVITAGQLPRLTAANGSAVTVTGLYEHCVRLEDGPPLLWQFVVADVGMPILGADFLSHHRLTVDVRQCLLLDTSGRVQARGSPSVVSSLAFPPTAADSPYRALLAEFPVVTADASQPTPVRHSVTHHIVTTGPPRKSRPRRLAPDRLAVARREFDKLYRLGVIRPSQSSWASPLHLVPKATPGEWRPCGDYRALNAVTVPDRYPLPYLQDFASQLHGCRVFTKLDLVRAYNHIPVEPADVHKTAVTTPFGLWEMVRLPYGLSNASQTFQRFIDEVLRDCPNCFAYLDDILIARRTEAEPLVHLRRVLTQLSAYGVVLNSEKCVFGVPRLQFLGHDVSADGIAPLPAKVAAVQDFPRPRTERDLRSFIGLVTFYHRFMPDTAALLRPLHGLLTNRASKSTRPVIWTDDTQSAFETVKARLAEATRLAHPVPGAPLSIQVDASDTGVGGVLQQYVNGCWTPLSYFSKTLKPAETRYSTFGRELLACYLAIRHFRHSVEGRDFILFTDHRPLVSAIGCSSDRHAPRETRHLDFVSQFTTDVRHVPGKDNSAADALSRVVSVLSVPQPPLDDFVALAATQRVDPDLQAFLAARHSLRLRDAVLADGSTLLVDESTGRPRPLLPEEFRKHYFRLLHGLSHPGVRATQHLIAQRFVWPSMHHDIAAWTRACRQCQRAKVQRHTRTPVRPFPLPAARFDHVHIDLVGPLPPSAGDQYLLTCVDRFTRWVEALPIPDIRAETVARAFVAGWVARFGVPSCVTTDRGAQFESGLWRELSRLLGCDRIRTTSYHPQSNGLVERFHRQLKTALRAADPPGRWTDLLPLVLLGIRSALKEDLHCTSAELVYGQPLRLPGELVSAASDSPHLAPASYVDQLRRAMRRVRPTAPRSPSSTGVFVPRAVQDCEHVFVRRDASRPPLTPPYDGPFRVLRRSDKTVTVSRNGKDDTVSLDRVKPAFVDAPAASPCVAEPPAPAPCSTAGLPPSGPRLLIPSVPPAPPADPAPQSLPVPPSRCDALPPPEGSPRVAPSSPLRSALRTKSGREVRVPLRFRHVTFLYVPP